MALLAACVMLSGARPVSGANETPKGDRNFKGALELIDSATQAGNRHVEGKAEYCFEEYMVPLWAGSTSYDETVLMLKDKGLPEADLLYVPERIVSVRSPDLKTEYQAGKDYVVKGRTLTLTADSPASYLTVADLYPAQAARYASAKRGGGYVSIKLPDGRQFCEVQLRVTYTHTETGFGAYVPPAFGDKLIPRTIAKLQKGEALKIVFYGDSISAGAEPSGFRGKPPHLPSWFTLVQRTLSGKYPSALTVENPSVGGKASDWGRANAAALVASKIPQVVVIGFGMGDAHAVNNFSPATYKANIKSIMDTVRAKNPECEFMLVSPMLANPEAVGFSGCQAAYVKPLQELQDENAGVELVDVTTATAFLLSRKKFGDISGNGVNHPGDYLTRVYAQAVLAALFQH